jgi:DNA-binding CsgD family transcriptional regulator
MSTDASRTGSPHGTALVERDEPLALLTRELAASRIRGRIVSLIGEAGVGKTSLLQALEAAAPDKTEFFWGACEALDTPRPLGPLMDMAADLGPDVETLLTSGAPRHHVFAAFGASIGRRRTPTCVVFEDVHWADEATLELLRYVSRRIHRVAALVVLTWRAELVGPDHPLYRLLGELPADSTERVELAPLSLEAVTALAGSAADGQAVFALTGGNAFFVTEVLCARNEKVPASVRDAILARRRALPAPTRQVIDFVSVIPSRAEVELLRANINTVAEDVLPAVETGLLTFDGRTLGFRHELARLAVLESLPLMRVQEMHRAVLSTLGATPSKPGVLARLVHHAVGAGDTNAVQRFAPQAAQQAAAVGAHREAASHYRASLAWAEGLDAETRASLLDQLGYECHLTGDMLAAREARTEALALWRELGDTRAIGRDLRWLSRLAWFIGDTAEAGLLAKESLDVLQPLGDDGQLAMALSNRSQLHMLAREHDDCVRLGQQAIEMARRIGSVEVLTHALNNVGTSRVNAGDLSGRAMQEESLSLALDHDLHEHAARAFTNMVSSAVHARDYLYARRWLDRGISYAVERDLESWSLYLLAARARLLAETGRWPEAEADAKHVIDSPLAIAVAKIPALTILGMLAARQRLDGAADLLDRALALALPTRESQRLVPVRAARAELALLQGRPDAARAEADAGLALLPVPDRFWDGELLHYLHWRAAGGADRRRKLASRTAANGPHGLQMRGEWKAAAEAWGRIGCPYERAEALAEGDVAAKEEALQVFLSLGAAAAADRVRQELRRVGVTRLQRGPRKSTREHPAGLTRRESEILELLGRDLSNPEIGERLFVSPKTVEHHVSAILGKLGVAARADAVIEARRRGWLDDPGAAPSK